MISEKKNEFCCVTGCASVDFGCVQFESGFKNTYGDGRKMIIQLKNSEDMEALIDEDIIEEEPDGKMFQLSSKASELLGWRHDTNVTWSFCPPSKQKLFINL